jgi:hypothetical protein
MRVYVQYIIEYCSIFIIPFNIRSIIGDAPFLTEVKFYKKCFTDVSQNLTMVNFSAIGSGCRTQDGKKAVFRGMRFKPQNRPKIARWGRG